MESLPLITCQRPLLAPGPASFGGCQAPIPSPAPALVLQRTPSTSAPPKHGLRTGLPSTDLAPWTLHGACTQEEMLNPPQHPCRANPGCLHPQGHSEWAQGGSPGPALGSGHCPLSRGRGQAPGRWSSCATHLMSIDVKFLKKRLPWFQLRVGTWCQQGTVAPSFLQLVTFRFCCLSACSHFVGWSDPASPHLRCSP